MLSSQRTTKDCLTIQRQTVLNIGYLIYYISLKPKLFPLDCGWRFGGDVVGDAVDAADFVDDVV